MDKQNKMTRKKNNLKTSMKKKSLNRKTKIDNIRKDASYKKLLALIKER